MPDGSGSARIWSGDGSAETGTVTAPAAETHGASGVGVILDEPAVPGGGDGCNDETAGIFDDFDRSVTGTWGKSRACIPWNGTGVPGKTSVDVVNGEGVLTITGINRGNDYNFPSDHFLGLGRWGMDVRTAIVEPGTLNSMIFATPFDMTFRVRFENLPSTNGEGDPNLSGLDGTGRDNLNTPSDEFRLSYFGQESFTGGEVRLFPNAQGLSLDPPLPGVVMPGIEVSWGRGETGDFSGIDYNRPLWVRIQVPNPEMVNRYKWWADGDPEPAVWGAELPSTDSLDSLTTLVGPLNMSFTEWQQSINGYDFGIAGWVNNNSKAIVDNVTIIDMRGPVTALSADVFDDFIRLVAPADGTLGSIGAYTWVSQVPGNVDDTCYNSDAGSSAALFANASVPSIQKIAGTGSDPWSDAFLFSAMIYSIDDTLPSGYELSWAVRSPDGLTDIKIAVRPGILELSYVTGGVRTVKQVAGPVFVVPGTTQTTAPVFMVRWQYIPGSNEHEAKFWCQNTPEPDWMLNQGLPVSPGAAPDLFMGWSQSGPGTRELDIPWIDFVYDDKPCPCDESTTSTFDDFARTVSGGWG